jgi:protein phosphatase
VHSVSDLKLAPFHLLATEGQVHVQRDHVWHMEKLAEICKAGDGLLLATPYKVVDVTDTANVEEVILWWEEMTGRGGEGMVVKPLDFIVRGRRGLTQPAVKCRGPEYLRIIYGPEYLLPENSAGYMNASSVCWPSKASQSILASSRGRLQRSTAT